MIIYRYAAFIENGTDIRIPLFLFFNGCIAHFERLANYLGANWENNFSGLFTWKFERQMCELIKAKDSGLLLHKLLGLLLIQF